MNSSRRFNAVGLMSGTSMDGIDAALLETDGEAYLAVGPHVSLRYPSAMRHAMLGLPRSDIDVASLERELTDLHCRAVRTLCATAGVDLANLDVVGFHGQTIMHAPEVGKTWQLGDGQLMADALVKTVVNNFRQNDMQHGGQGAPLAPAYHQVLVRACGIPQPVAILNIGGVSNVTLVAGDMLYACDCGPGNALIDDWVNARCGVPYDDGGSIAAAGLIDEGALAVLLGSEFFSRGGPKSLDRNAFSPQSIENLSPEDGAATLTAFTAAAIAIEAQRLSPTPNEWVVVGGGRLNLFLVAELRRRLPEPVRVAEDVGWQGDSIEAHAFAYLAVRSLLQLPLSWPSTTGVSAPVSGGDVWRPRSI